MAYNPDETARPRSFSDKAATVSRYGLALPTAGAIAVGSIAGFLHGGSGMLIESGQKALGLRPNESYEDLANRARQREAAPAGWISEHAAFGEEASEMLNKTIGGIFEYVNKTGERKGQEILEATGSPLAATIAESSFKILPYLGAEVLGFRGARAAKQAATIKGTDFVPTPKEWKASFATPKNRSRYQRVEWTDLEHPEPTSKFDVSPNEPVKEVKPPIDAVALEEKYLSEGQGMALDLESRGFPVMYNGPQMNARGELAYHTFTITEKGMETTFGGKTLDDVVAKYNTIVREFGREDLVKEVKTVDQLFDELRSHPLYQKREALYADNMEISLERGKDRTKEHPDLDKREAENRKEIEALSKQIDELPENKAWMKQRDADNLVLQKQELEGQRDYDLANRDKWDKAPRHGTDIDALPGILEEGLRYGSAIDVSKGFDWAGESPIQIILPSVRKGTRIEHNNYYKSGNVARAAKVIVDLDHYTESASASVKEQILALAEKHKDVEFVIKEGKSETILNSNVQKRTIPDVLKEQAPDNIADAAFITAEGKPVGSLKDGGHGATIENITAELGWDDLFTHEDMGRAATTERIGLINRVALEGENIFATSDKTMTHEAAQKAVARYLRDAGIEEGSLEFNGELEVVKAAPGKKNIVPPKPKGKAVKSPVRKVRKPRVKPDPLEGLDQDMTIGEISKTGRDYMSPDQLAAQIEKTVEKGDTNAFLRAAVKFTAQAKKRKSILLAKQYARAICADLPDNIHHTYKAIIEDLRSGIDHTFRSEKRMADLNSTMKYLKSQPKEMDAMPSRILKLLAKKHLNDFTLRDLHEIHDRIYNPQNGLIKLGQLRRSLELAKEQRAVNAVIEGMLESLAPQKISWGYVPRDVLSPEPRALKKRSIIDKIKHGKLMTLIPQHVFDIFDNNANFGGVFHEFLYKQADRTVTQERRMSRVIADRADARMEQLGIKLKDWNKRTQVAGTTMSRQQMLGVYLAQKNPYNYHLMQELHPELTNARIQAIIAELTPQEKAFGKHILEDHAKSYSRIAEVLGKVSNQTLGKEPNYTNIVFDRPEFERLSFEDKVNVTLSMRESIKRAVPFDKFTLERLGLPANAKPRLNLNAIDNWYNHVANREHYIAAAEWTKQANRIISDKRLLGELERTHGEPAVEYIRSYIQEIANPRSIRDMSHWAQVSRLLRRNTAVAYIGLNPNSVLIQTASIPKFLRDAGAFNLAGSIVKFCRNPVEMYKRVCEWEPQIKDRYFERELQELGEIHKTVVGGAIEKGQKAVLTPTTLMDRIAIVVGYDAVYKRYVKDLGHEGAKQKALDVVNRTQSGTHPKDLAPLYKQKNEALNWVTIFTNDLSKSWGEAFHTLPADIKAGRIMEAMYTTAGFGLMAIIAYTILHKTFPDSPEKIADAFTEQSLAMLPLVGSVTMARKQGYADAGSPVMNTLSLPGYLLSDNSASSKRRKALEAAAILTGVPFSAPKKVAMSIKEDNSSLLFGRGDDWKHKSGGSNRRLGIGNYRSRRSRSGRKYLR